MNDSAPPEPEQRPPLSELLVELTRDASSFAQAEMAYLKAQAGERAHFAVPGLVMIGVALMIAAGLLMAVPVALIWWLAPLIGVGWSLLAVAFSALVLSALLLKFGTRRIKSVLKRPEDR